MPDSSVVSSSDTYDMLKRLCMSAYCCLLKLVLAMDYSGEEYCFAVPGVRQGCMDFFFCVCLASDCRCRREKSII